MKRHRALIVTMLVLFHSFIFISFVRADSVSGSDVCVRVANDQTVCGPQVDVNANAATQKPFIGTFAVDKQRSAVFPISEGVAYYNIGQITNPITHYPFDRGYPQFSEFNQVVRSRKSGSAKQNVDGVLSLPEAIEKGRSQTNILNPPNHRQSDLSRATNSYYLSVPVTEYRHDSPLARTHLPLHAPSVTVNLPPTGHLSKPEIGSQAASVSSSSLSSGGPLYRPAVQYSTHYVLENPVVPPQQTVTPQAQVVPTISRIPVILECEVKPAFSAPPYSGFRGSSPESIFTEIPVTGQLERDAEEPKDKKLDGVPRQSNALAANQGHARYENYVRQMNQAQIQYHYDEILRNAHEIELRAKQLSNQQRSSSSSEPNLIDTLASELSNQLEQIKKNQQKSAHLRHQLANIGSVQADATVKPSPASDKSSSTPQGKSADENARVSALFSERSFPLIN